MNGVNLLFWLMAITSWSSLPTAIAANDDLFIQSRIDQTSTNWLIDKTRLLMNHAAISDGLTGTVPIPSDTTLVLSTLSNDPHYVKTEEVITQLFGVDFKTAVLRVRIPKVYYNIDTLHATPKSFQVNDPILSLQATAALQGIDIGLINGVQLDIMFLNPKSKVLESYLTVSIDPVTASLSKDLPPATFDVAFDTIRGDKLNYKLKSYNLDSLPAYVKEHEKDAIIKTISTNGPLTVDQIKVNPIVVKLGHLTRSIEFDDLKPLIQLKMNDILASVIGQVGVALKTTLGPLILNTAFSLSTRSSIEVSTDSIYTSYQATEFDQPVKDQIKLDVFGDMCTKTLYNQFQALCVTKTEKVAPIRITSETDHQTASDEVTTKLEHFDADVALSASEEYINRILKTTIDAKMWEPILAAQHLALGEKGAFVVFNKDTKTPDIFLDIIYSGEGKGLSNLFVNERHSLHFPLRMSTSLAFENRDNIPFMIIKTEKLLSDVDEIVHGIPEYDLTSDLTLVLKRKVAKMIIKMAGTIEGQTAVEMALPMFRDIGLEKTWYEVSSHGRVNLYFKL